MLEPMVTMNISLDEDLAKAIEELAKRTNRPVDRIVADAARAHVEYTRRVLDDIEEGRKADRRGPLLHHGVKCELELDRRARSVASDEGQLVAAQLSSARTFAGSGSSSIAERDPLAAKKTVGKLTEEGRQPVDDMPTTGTM